MLEKESEQQHKKKKRKSQKTANKTVIARTSKRIADKASENKKTRINNSDKVNKNKDSCYKCGILFKKTDNTWISCEKCSNKLCNKCFPKNFRYTDEYYCKNCCEKV